MTSCSGVSCLTADCRDQRMRTHPASPVCRTAVQIAVAWCGLQFSVFISYVGCFVSFAFPDTFWN